VKIRPACQNEISINDAVATAARASRNLDRRPLIRDLKFPFGDSAAVTRLEPIGPWRSRGGS
jgi:hypothetical protein